MITHSAQPMKGNFDKKKDKAQFSFRSSFAIPASVFELPKRLQQYSALALTEETRSFPNNYSLRFYLLPFFFHREKFVVHEESHQNVNLSELFELACEGQKIEKLHLLQNVFRIEVINKDVGSKSGNRLKQQREGTRKTSKIELAKA